jgi:hypothetical protein
MSGLHLLFHVSNHGYGHAARAGVLAAALLERPEIAALAIAVPASYGGFFAAALRDPRCALVDVPTDLGIPLRPGEFAPDPRHVARELERWLAAWPTLLAETEVSLGDHRIDGVVADASPLAFALATRLHRPAIAVTNFEWHAQYVGLGLFGAAVDAVGEAYAGARAYLRYPLSLPSEVFSATPTLDVPACARTAAKERVAELVRNLPAPRIVVSLGGLVDLRGAISLSALDGTLVFTKGLILEAPRAARIVDLSAGVADAVSYIGAADLVVTKGGWSTVAEAASAKKALLLVARPTVPEDRHILAGVERAGLGTGCRLEDLSCAVARAIATGLRPTPGLPNDPPAVAAACVASLS